MLSGSSRVYPLRASTASSTTTTASCPPATGAPLGSFTVTSTAVDVPGATVFDRGTTVTSRAREAVEIDSINPPAANAGRNGAFGKGVPSSAARGVVPTTSIDTSTFGMSASVMVTGTIAEPSTTSNRFVATIAPRLSVSRPSPVANGDWTSSCAVSPGAYFWWSGTTVRVCCSTLGVGVTTRPLTQRVNCERLDRPESSTTFELIVYSPPVPVVNEHMIGSVPDVTLQVCGSTWLVAYAPFSKTDAVRVAVTTSMRPGTALPSMSVTIASMSRGAPWSTNVRSPRRPT